MIAMVLQAYKCNGKNRDCHYSLFLRVKEEKKTITILGTPIDKKSK